MARRGLPPGGGLLKQGPDTVRSVVYLIGVGRMGRLIANSLASDVDLVLAGRDLSRIDRVAREVGARTASLAAPLEDAEAVILALPTEATGKVLAEIAPRLPARTIVINVATAVLRKDLQQFVPGDRLAAAKFVSHYYDMEAGGKSLIVVEAGTPETEERTRRLMGSCGPVVAGQEEWVLAANRLAAEEGVRASIRMQHRLRAAGVPESIISQAVTGVAVGCIRAFMDGKLGPFGQAIADRVQAELDSGEK